MKGIILVLPLNFWRFAIPFNRQLRNGIILSLTLIGSLLGTRASAQPRSLADLKRLSACELTRLFEQAEAGPIPVGYAKGQVLLMEDARLPKLRARLASTAWRGKHFEEGGEFINQWPGFTALRGKIEPGTSAFDGKPCLVLDYPPGTPLFGDMYDEMRQIAPGLYLARLYERSPCPHFRGYFAIQVCGCR
jgi:hypothetical protein